MYNYAFISNGETHINSYEPTGRDTIFMLRGLARSFKAWLGAERELSYNYDVICVDLPGVGISKEEKLLYSVDAIAEKMVEVLNYLDVKKVYVVGPSLGSMIAWEVVRKLPINRVEGVVIIVPSHTGLGLNRITPKAIKALSSSPVVSEEVKMGLLRDMLIGKTTDGNNIFETNPEVEQKWTECMKQDALDLGTKGQLAHLFAAGTYFSTDGIDYLKRNRIPLKFIISEKDAMVPVKHQWSIYEYVRHPNSSVVELKNAGHDFIVTHKEEIKQIISEFIEDKEKFNNNIPAPVHYEPQKNKLANKALVVIGLFILGWIVKYLLKKRRK